MHVCRYLGMPLSCTLGGGGWYWQKAMWALTPAASAGGRCSTSRRPTGRLARWCAHGDGDLDGNGLRRVCDRLPRRADQLDAGFGFDPRYGRLADDVRVRLGRPLLCVRPATFKRTHTIQVGDGSVADEPMHFGGMVARGAEMSGTSSSAMPSIRRSPPTRP